MNEQPLSYIVYSIQVIHGAKARLLRRERVVERFQGENVWEGEVLVFALQGHPTASWCYAWEIAGKVTTVLHEPPVDGAQAAVRAAIASRG